MVVTGHHGVGGTLRMATCSCREDVRASHFGSLPRRFDTVLVANRGEIAIRIFRAANELGLRTVGVFSKVDRNSLHRFEADEAYELADAGASPVDDYLNAAEVIAIAKRSNAGAIHPGYGFLSENAEFAEMCENAGIVFVGPKPSHIRLFGDKLRARALAHSCNVPVLPPTPQNVGEDERPLRSFGEVSAVVDRVGLPVVVKAVHGGGGKGIRFVHRQSDLRELYDRCVSEAKAAFGNGDVFVEKFVEDPRHIEVQILGDSHGNIIHLYERDCSVQLNNQKFVELAPCPSLRADLRARLLQAALSIARACGYQNAGTVEFLLLSDADLRRDAALPEFVFGELNPRIQVEHTVTEAVTGVDLVQAQLLIAAGASLGTDLELDQASIRCRGFAIQCRLNADFAHSTTRRIVDYREPSAPGVRVDSGVTAGTEISPHFDALLVKLICFAASFPLAISKTQLALSKFLISGVSTNRPLIESVLSHERFNDNSISTQFASSLVQSGGSSSRMTSDTAETSQVLRVVQDFIAEHFIPRRSPASPSESALISLKERLGKLEPSHSLSPALSERIVSSLANVSQNSTSSPLVSVELSPGKLSMFELCAISDIDPKGHRKVFLRVDGRIRISRVFDRHHAATGKSDKGGTSPGANSSHAQVKSPLGGAVVTISVKVGDEVKVGEILVVINVMKMEHIIRATQPGIVRDIHISPKDIISKGDVIITIEKPQKVSTAPSTSSSSSNTGTNRVSKVVSHLSSTKVPEDAVWRKEIEELHQRREFASKMGGERGVSRQRSNGKLTVRERIDLLLGNASKGSTDERVFEEIGGLAGKAKYDKDGNIIDFSPANFVGGLCTIKREDGATMQLMVGGDDFTVRGGHADGSVFGKQMYIEKMCRQLRIPMVRLLDGSSGGGSVASYLEMGATYIPMLKGFVDQTQMLGEVPCAAALLGPVVGLAAARAVTTHFSVAVREMSQLFVAGPPVVQWATHETVTKEQLGGTDIHGTNGSYDNIAESEVEAIDQVKRFLSYLPPNAWEIAPRVPNDDPVSRREDDLLSIIPRSRSATFEIRKLLGMVFDKGSFFEIGASWGTTQVCALARLSGYTVGVLASDSQSNGGCLTASGSQKVRRFVDLCDAFHIPIVGMVDNPGFAVGVDEEQQSCIRHGGSMIASLYGATVPWYTMIIRRAFGVGGGALIDRAALNERCAWPTGDWGSLPLEGGVEAAYKRQLREAEDPVKLKAELLAKFEAVRSPFRTAEQFGIERIIDPRETRPLLCRWAESAYRRLSHGDTIRPKYRFRP